LQSYIDRLRLSTSASTAHSRAKLPHVRMHTYTSSHRPHAPEQNPEAAPEAQPRRHPGGTTAASSQARRQPIPTLRSPSTPRRDPAILATALRSRLSHHPRIPLQRQRQHQTQRVYTYLQRQSQFSEVKPAPDLVSTTVPLLQLSRPVSKVGLRSGTSRCQVGRGRGL
jgi:hypothetical protein